MRRIGAWGLSIVLLVELTGVARSADPPWRRPTTAAPTSTSSAPSSNEGGLFSGWFGSKDRSADKKTDANTAKKNKAAKDRADGEKARATAAFLRRMAVCDKLKQIGFETGNEELQRIADDLLERAQATCSQRFAQLSAAGEDLESDEQSLEKHPGAKNAQDGRTSARKEKP